MGTHEEEAELASGAQLYRMNELGILPATVQITKEEASEILSDRYPFASPCEDSKVIIVDSGIVGSLLSPVAVA